MVVHILFFCTQIDDFDTEKRYSLMLRELLQDHSDVVTLLAEGFSECRKHLPVRIYNLAFWASDCQGLNYVSGGQCHLIHLISASLKNSLFTRVAARSRCYCIHDCGLKPVHPFIHLFITYLNHIILTNLGSVWILIKLCKPWECLKNVIFSNEYT